MNQYGNLSRHTLLVFYFFSTRSKNKYIQIFHRLLTHKLGCIGLIGVLIAVVTAVIAPALAPYDPLQIDYNSILSSPSFYHPFGTDELGRDMFSRVIYGAQISIQIVAVSVIGSVVVGSFIGLVAGYFGGWIDEVISRIMDGIQTFPMLILALAIVAALGPNLTNAMIAISVVNVPRFARLVRGQALAVRELDYVQAVRALGAKDSRIMLRHVWPNVSDSIIVFGSLRASTAMITESALSFLGLGAQPPTPTWGSMLTTGMHYLDAWWISVFPGLAIFFTVLALNFLGDGLRDVLDSRMTGS